MTQEHIEGDLRLFYIPQVPMKPYFVYMTRRDGQTDAALLEQTLFTLNAVVGLSIFEYDNNIKPDYSDVAGIERFEDDEWCHVDESEYEVDE